MRYMLVNTHARGNEELNRTLTIIYKTTSNNSTVPCHIYRGGYGGFWGKEFVKERMIELKRKENK